MDGQLQVVPGNDHRVYAVRLILVTVGIPRTRICLFQQPVPARSSSRPARPVTSGDRDPDPEAEGPIVTVRVRSRT